MPRLRRRDRPRAPRPKGLELFFQHRSTLGSSTGERQKRAVSLSQMNTFKSFKKFKPFKPLPVSSPATRGEDRRGLELSAAVERFKRLELRIQEEIMSEGVRL